MTEIFALLLIIVALTGFVYCLYRAAGASYTIDDVKGIECINKRCVEHPK